MGRVACERFALNEFNSRVRCPLLVVQKQLALKKCYMRALCPQRVYFASKMLVTGNSQAICSQQKFLTGTFLSMSVTRDQVARYR